MEYREVSHWLNSEYGCGVAGELSSIGNDESSMGFRNAGSTGEKKAALYIKTEMQKIGLENITEHPFEVDTWEYRGATLEYWENDRKKVIYPLSAFAGTKGLMNGVATAKVIYAGYGTYKDCKKLELKGAIAFIKINLEQEYWLGVPVYQLELQGAIAVIVMLEGNSYGVDDNVLNSANAAARPTIPILNISKKHGEELLNSLKKGDLTCQLETDISLSKGESCNITGEISGESEDKIILIGAHYDGYFRAYIDDAFGIGAMLNIARAMVNSCKKPRHKIVFIAHGAEEFGVMGSHFDWCSGSWQQITRLKPEWIERVRLFLNIDAVNPDTLQLLVQASPQLHPFLETTMLRIMEEVKLKWKGGFKLADINGTWSDDFSYYMEGIPVIMAGRGASAWRKKYYHTDFDVDKDKHFDLMKSICRVYCEILLRYDEKDCMPIDITKELEIFERNIDKGFLSKEGIETDELYLMIRVFKEKISQLSNYYTNGNTCREKVNRLSICVNNNLIKAIRRINFDDNVVFKLTEEQKNLKSLNKIKNFVKKEEYSKAFKAIEAFYGGVVLSNFEERVYKYWYIDMTDHKKSNLQWAKGRFEKPLDIRNLYIFLKNMDAGGEENGDVKAAIYDEISFLKVHEKKKIKSKIAQLVKVMGEINKISFL